MFRKKNSNDKTKIRTKLFVWCIVLVLMAAIAIADVDHGLAEANLWANVSVAQIGAGDSRESIFHEGMIPVFKCEENFGVRKALALLGSICGKNIVPSPNVDGMLAFRQLTNVTFDEVMDAILGDNFRYVKRGSLIRVYTKDEYNKIMSDPERMTYKVFTLYYISAAEAMNLIAPVLSSAGSIQGSSPAENIVPTGDSISAGSGGGDTMALNDTIVIADYPENIVEVEKMLKQLDVRPKQVLVEATILSATLTEGMEMGVDLSFMAGVSLTGASTTSQVGTTESLSTSTTTPISQVAAGTRGTPLETSGFASVGGSGLRVGVTSGEFAAFITALEQVTDTTILANPKILAVNKQLGQVYIGNKIGYTSQTTQTQTSTTQQVEFLDTGTKLSFRPYIGDDGYIRMDIHPKDSSGTLKTNDIPDEFSTELATNIIVKDGQTIVIGGLFRDVVVTSRSQIPLLGDLPLIGVFFRSTSDSVQRQEVIVLLTPHIIDEAKETNSDARIDDIRRKKFGTKDELQWAGKARLAEDRYATAARYYLEGDTEAAMNELNYVLELRPSYLEAIRLKERIIGETRPDELDSMERILLGDIEREDSDKWRR
ncbi:MAG: type II secretion system protein GspD [Planctomycetes bacterium]|nr:type II secretion system protein GspD [Planctomycetota bacterium]